MPALTANYSATLSPSVKENLTDILTVLDPVECPVQANIGEVSVDNPEAYEWQLDSLDDPTAAGVVDGVAFSAIGDSIQTRVKLLSRCQIQARGISISNRTEQTDRAGVDSEISTQLAYRADELKRDCESAITTFRTPVASASGTAPLTAGIPTWIRSNASYGATGAAPTLSGSEPVVGTGGTDRALSQATFLSLLGEAYVEGGNIDMIVVSPAIKQRMSQFFFTSDARIATQYQDAGARPGAGLQVVGAVDYYVSDFGVLAIVPSRLLNQATDVLMLDTSLWKKGTFRGMETMEMGLDGDRQNFMVLHDFCLVSLDEAGSAIHADTADLAMVA